MRNIKVIYYAILLLIYKSDILNYNNISNKKLLVEINTKRKFFYFCIKKIIKTIKKANDKFHWPFYFFNYLF